VNRRRIPRTIRLPFGYLIKVEQVTKREMEDECGDHLDGAWMAEYRTIYLRRSLNMTRKRYILCHELQHAVADLTHQQLNDGVGRP
jgi:Zn-dependent peptidase ImmA (M78 family)